MKLFAALVAALLAFGAAAEAITIETVRVGYAGNPGELSGDGAGGNGPDRVCGAVSYSYNVGKFEVTTAQYTAFLNAVAATDAYGLYNSNMDTAVYGNACNIKRSGASGSYVYTVGDGSQADLALYGNRPVHMVSYWDACRFANWLHNGQPTGAQNASTTERGAYTLDGQVDWDGRTIQRNAGWKWAVTCEDEWYKAAYYKGGGRNAGYWDLPMQSNWTIGPSNDITTPDAGNNANYHANDYTLGPPLYRTEVGEFENSESAFGTFDQGGNVWEWNESVIDVTKRGLRGGSAYSSPAALMSGSRYYQNPAFETNEYGFRVVSAVGDSWPPYGVRMGDLGHLPELAGPVRIWGRVTSEAPLRISDGGGEVAVTGMTANLDDFLIVTGDWTGTALNVTAAYGAFGPANAEMIYIPAGSFLMGNNGSEPYSFSDELPQHSVDLAGYWIGKYEVTRGQYAQFMAAEGYSNPAYWSSAGWTWKVNSGRTKPFQWDNPVFWGNPPGSWNQTDKHPVVGVTYHEAEAFCNWAGGHLPTEAQWEKAARWTGSYPNVYPWGNTWDAERCNNTEDHNPAGGGYQYYQTAPVGSYSSGVSPYRLHDMAGNVWEWVQDWYKSYPGSSSPFDYTGTYRAMRGGGFTDYATICFHRCAWRGYYDPSSSYYHYGGLRLAR